jgi:NitT/TauT family transport system substrate-binding protein
VGLARFRVASFAAAAIMVMTAGCGALSGTGDPASSSQEGGTDITVAALPSDDLAGLYIAAADGIFAQQGLHITIEKIASSQAVIAAQLKGEVDIGAGSYVPYIAAQAANAKFRILAEASTLRTDTRVLVTTAHSPIKSVADLAGKKIGVNGTNSIGTLLISVLLQENGIPLGKVHFVTDKAGFPAMPGALAAGAWSAAFLAEPYMTIAEEDYGMHVVADLDEGATTNFPIDGYVVTQAWAKEHPGVAAAFVRAIQQGQDLANVDPSAAQAAVAKYDALPRTVTAVMALPGFPTGPVNDERIQRTADFMLQLGMLPGKYAGEVGSGGLVKSMIGLLPGCAYGSLRGFSA